MSEGPNPSEPASETETSEKTSKPAGGRNKKLMIIAIAVVLILIGSTVAIMALPGKKTEPPHVPVLSVSINPSPFILEAGKSANITAYVMDGSTNISATAGVSYKWVADVTIGELLLKAKQKVTLNPVKDGSNGTIKVTVTYMGVSKDATASVRVNAPYLESIQMNPPTMNVGHFKTKTITATAVSSVGTVLPVTNFTWNLTGMGHPDCELWGQYDDSVQFNTTDIDKDGIILNATASYSTYYGGVKKKTGSTLINVSNIVAPRSVDYRWYDFFNVPFGDYWYDRTSGEIPYTTTYPYIFKLDMGAGNVKFYGNARLNVTAKNITEINSNMFSSTVRPFIPHWGIATGGNIEIDWSLRYPTYDEFHARWPALGGFDGWFVELYGTILLDKQAALGMLGHGLNANVYDTGFDSWWASNNLTINTDYQQWFQNESTDKNYWIYPAYDGEMMQEAFDISAHKVAGDKVLIRIDSLTWGMEMLIARWLRSTFMPTEWYYDDFHMNMQIGPETSNVNIDTAIVYAMYAYETINVPPGMTKGEPTWVWQALLQDYISTPSHNLPVPGSEHPYNEYENYTKKTYVYNAPGSSWYGQSMAYDYVPGNFDLKENETLTFDWPAAAVKFFVGTGIGTYVEIQDKINVTFAMPLDKDNPDYAPGKAKTDLKNHTLTYTGPIDFAKWSKTQHNDTYLVNEWARLDAEPGAKGLQPLGAPYIEFKTNQLPPPVAYRLKVEGMESPVVAGDSSSTVKVSVYDQYDHLFPSYAGTVHFVASGTATGLPADYPFAPGTDHGVHNFTGIALTGSGNYWLNVSDVADVTIKGGMQVFVIPEAEHVDHFVLTGLPGNINVGDPVGVTVTAYDQFGLQFWRYAGEVTFLTNATSGTYTAAENYTFVPADRGAHRFAPAITFNGVGLFSLTVADTANLSALGTADDILVKVSPEISYTLYDIFEPKWNEWWWERSGYEIDLILNNTPHNHTMLYNKANDGMGGVTYAPYRWKVDARNMTTMNVDMPLYMPAFGPKGVANARANMTMYWNYINNTWYNESWYDVWKNNIDWQPSYNSSIRTYQLTDGYVVGTLYNVTMNREAALTWLNLSLTEPDVAAWWIANHAKYRADWIAWVLYEGNVRLDVYAGYDDMYYDVGTMMDLKELPNGDLMLSIGHFSWGYDVLFPRQNTDSKINTHETYMEDVYFWANYTNAKADVAFDGVCQWSLRAVRANGTSNGSAWAWEPMKVDYVTAIGHHSDYAPYEYNPFDLANTTYTDWNALDPNYGFGLGTWTTYENTPAYFNLTSYQKLTIILPQGDQVIGYKGEPTWVDTLTYSSSSILNATYYNDFSDFDRLTVHGKMTLGYYKSGGVNIESMYDAVNNTIVMQGPLNFDNYHLPSGYLYHGAPWIEFNITPLPGTPGPAWTNSVPIEHVAPAQASTGTLAMAAALFSGVVALSALVVFSRRKLE